ncbi:hypothetical protein M5K25_022167 [Dendrobium thyrsiflorum]|uniref:Uncharacterized protein n=1 Tax=Dendrobium thyrsiflorum TaxID=117978 RepID=A0ABD0U5T4_DENTH
MDTRAAPQEKPKPPRTAFRLHGGSAAAPSPSSWLEIRLFYVRIFPCAADAVPPNLILSHLRRDTGVALEINGSRVPSWEPTFLTLRRDRLDCSAGEVTYLSTDGVRLTGSVEFEVCDGDGNLILCGSLENMEAPGIIRTISFAGHRESCYDPKARWSMNCFSAASIASSAFIQPKFGISSPSIEVYVAGCFAGSPSILTQTIQLSQIKKVARTGALDAIPEDTEASCNPVRMNSLVYIMYNRRLRDRNLKKKGLMDDEDPLLCKDVASEDECFVDDEVEVMPSELKDKDLNVDFFEGKRKITDIEEGADWETLDSIGEEEGERAVHHNDDSNKDPLSDDSADDL